MTRALLLTLLLTLLLCGAGSASKPTLGKPAPDFSLAGLTSKERITLSELRGKVVFIDFWASWCVPCRRLMPKLAGLKARFPDLEMVAISVDENRNKAITFIRGIEPGLRAVHDADQKVSNTYDLEGMPTCFLVDKQGNLRFRHDGYTAEDLDKVQREARLLLSEP